MGIIGNGLCLCCSTTVGTAETFIAAVVPVTSWRCPPTLGPCGCVICVTPCYYSGAPLVLPDTKSCCCWWWFEILHCSHVKEIQHSTLMGGAYLGHTNTFIGWWEGFDWLISIFQRWNTFEPLLRIISLAGLLMTCILLLLSFTLIAAALNMQTFSVNDFRMFKYFRM